MRTTLDLMTDDELVTRVSTGCNRAGGELFRRHHGVAVRYARGLASDVHAADDLAAEAFTRTLEKIAEGVRPRSFRAYLFRVLRNHWIDRHRRDAKLHLVPDHPGSEQQAVLAGDPRARVVDIAEHVTSRMTMAAALDELPHRQRLVLWRTLVEGDRMDEVAAELGITANAAAAIAHRARKSLATAYSGHDKHRAALSSTWPASVPKWLRSRLLAGPCMCSTNLALSS